MALRDFALNNFRWKLTALLLAMLVWFVISSEVYRGATGSHSQALTQQVVMVLKSPEDPRIFRIKPAVVDVLVQAAKELHPEDLQVFVDLTSMPDVDVAYKQVLVRGTDASKAVVQPPGVTVERVSPPHLSLTNSLSRP
jgi:hypothetical protein